MKTKQLLIYLAVFAVSLGVGTLLFQAKERITDGAYTEVDWRQLQDLDYLSGSVSPALKALDGKEVKIPGFMVPLEDNMRKVTQFLLVPTPQACIHVPPPPPNQMVFVEFKEGEGVNVEYGLPIWTYGTLVMTAKKHLYGESSFQMKGIRIEPYK